MRARSGRIAVVVGVGVLTGLVGAGLVGAGLVGPAVVGERPAGEPAAAAAEPRVQAASAVRTRLPGLSAPTGEPVPAGLARLRPRAGSAVQAPGPFDDRLRWGGLRFDGHRVSGSVQVVSDVSEVLELEVVGGFYDRKGRLLGTARFVHPGAGHAHEAHEHRAGSEAQRFAIDVPTRWRGQAVAAAVGVPVLVNE